MNRTRFWAGILGCVCIGAVVGSCGDSADPTAPKAAADQPGAPDQPGALDEPIVPGPSFGATSAGNGSGDCMFQDAVDAGYKQSKLQCTAEDIDIADVIINEYRVFTGPPSGPFLTLGPGERISCLPGQTIEVNVDAVLENNAQARYDIGLWINPDPGASAPDGSGDGANTGLVCDHFNLVEGLPGVAELDRTDDACGDMASGVTTEVNLEILTLACEDPNQDGVVDLDACTAWENNTTGANEVICPLDPPGGPEGFRQGTTPGTGSKCKCGVLGLPIDIRSVLRVTKVTVPDPDPTDPDQEFAFTSDADGITSFSLSNGETASSDPISEGTYSVSETVPAGWDLTSATCDNSDDPSAVTLGQGDDVTCTFTNTKRGSIAVKKVTLPSGETQSFSFTGDVVASLMDGQTSTPVVVVPGSYSATETVPAGWDLTSISCDDGNSTGAGATATFNVEPGEDVICTFTNTKRGTIIVEKQTDPDGALASFTFTGDAAGIISDGQQIVVSNMVPGAYSSTEIVPEGWELTGITCDDGNSSGSGATATFNVEPGETVTCIFNNLEVKICELGERLVSVTLEVTGLSDSPVELIPIEKQGQTVTNVTVTDLVGTHLAAVLGTEFTVTPLGGAANFATQNLRFLIDGEESKNLKVHLSCSDDPAVGDVHFGNNDSGVSVELTKTALSSAPKFP
ncbi:MAG: hypothetical protein HKM89_03865 [Gemmatimonadales bacterium]|nr:hypothetical protein [Gemmatimonadales bacterium]